MPSFPSWATSRAMVRASMALIGTRACRGGLLDDCVDPMLKRARDDATRWLSSATGDACHSGCLRT